MQAIGGNKIKKQYNYDNDLCLQLIASKFIVFHIHF